MYTKWKYEPFLLNTFSLTMMVITVFAAVPQSVLSSRSKVLLRDIEALTFHEGAQTSYYWSHPVNQLECIGGSAAKFPEYKPTAVQCYNHGFDGHSVQWKCNAELPTNVRFGHLDINCEGYEYPEDKYILTGSCALRYELDFKSGRSSYRPVKGPLRWLGGNFWGSNLYPGYLFIGGLLLVAFAVWYLCLRDISTAAIRSEPNVDFHTPAYPDDPPNYEETMRTNARSRAQPSAPMPDTDYGWNVPPRGTGYFSNGRTNGSSQRSSQWRKSRPPPASSTHTTTDDSNGDGYGWLAGAATAGAVLGTYLWGSRASPSSSDSVSYDRGFSGRCVRRRSSSSDRRVYTATGYTGTSRR